MLKTLLLLLLTAMFATACGTQTQTPTEAPIENYPAPLESEASGYPALRSRRVMLFIPLPTIL